MVAALSSGVLQAIVDGHELTKAMGDMAAAERRLGEYCLLCRKASLMMKQLIGNV
jgi:hypothetical protein